jgi:protein tyrosine phosphatase (PTP) superfamily phosphohydrolase (DUF442 family)
MSSSRLLHTFGRARPAACVLASALLLGGCSVGGRSDESTLPESPPRGSPSPPAARSTELPGIDHYRRWSDRLGQGSQPQGDTAFAALAAQGFTTILSVDGAMPDVEAAARHGLSYVHVPIGYDGIDREKQLQIVKATSASEGPIFVHCHHGLHRGPTATAIARIAIDGVTPSEAYRGLKQSGCSPKYAGLYLDVASFVVPDASVIRALAAPPAQVRPAGIRASMVNVDELWATLSDCRAAGWTSPRDHPDVEPAHEALMLQEHLRELARIDAAQTKGEDFLALLSNSERLAGELSRLLDEGDQAEAAEGTYVSLKQSCTKCHTDYRD